MREQAKRARQAVELQNALSACKGRLEQRENQIVQLRARTKEARERESVCGVELASSKEREAVGDARMRAQERVNEDLRTKLASLRKENETLRVHHNGRMEHIRQLQADLASVSSLGAEESMLFSGGGGRSGGGRSGGGGSGGGKTTEEKVNMSLQYKLDCAENELKEMKQRIDDVTGSGGGGGNGGSGGGSGGSGGGGGVSTFDSHSPSSSALLLSAADSTTTRDEDAILLLPLLNGTEMLTEEVSTMTSL